MKFHSLLFVALCTACLLSAVSQKTELINPKLPLTIRYRQPVPPDSVTGFLNVCFTMGKVRVVDTAEAKRILREHMESTFKEQRDLIQSGNWSMEKNQQFLEGAKQPILNILVVKFFKGQELQPGDYQVDSIDWQIRTPERDTAFFNRYKPGNLDQSVYTVLKNFADTVMASGQLR